MLTRLKATVLAVIFGLLVCFMSGQRVHALSGITVAPALLRLSLSDGTPTQDAAVSVRNDFTGAVSISAEIYKTDDSRSAIVPTNSPDLLLKQVITITPSSVELKPGQSINLLIHAVNIPGLSPGGHYASLLIKQQPLAGQQINVVQAVSVSLFITKEDGAIRELALTAPRLSKFTFRFPQETELTFKNKGNVDVVPRAAISIVQNGRFRVLAKGVVNTESIPLFPGRDVTLVSSIQRTAPAWLPGKYQMIVRFRPDGSKLEQTATFSFWYVPYWLLLALFFLLMLVVWLFQRRGHILYNIARKKFVTVQPVLLEPVQVKKPPATRIYVTDSADGQSAEKAVEDTAKSTELNSFEPVSTKNDVKKTTKKRPKSRKKKSS